MSPNANKNNSVQALAIVNDADDLDCLIEDKKTDIISLLRSTLCARARRPTSFLNAIR